MFISGSYSFGHKKIVAIDLLLNLKWLVKNWKALMASLWHFFLNVEQFIGKQIWTIKGIDPHSKLFLFLCRICIWMWMSFLGKRWGFLYSPNSLSEFSLLHLYALHEQLYIWFVPFISITCAIGTIVWSTCLLFYLFFGWLGAFQEIKKNS